MCMEDERFKDEGKGFEITRGEDEHRLLAE